MFAKTLMEGVSLLWPVVQVRPSQDKGSLRSLKQKSTLVLLPSLLLLSKTVSDWLVESKQDFRFLAVCSDSSVTKKMSDQIDLSTSELGFGITTDADEIASFLKRRGNKVIFSTYQSSLRLQTRLQYTISSGLT